MTKKEKLNEIARYCAKESAEGYMWADYILSIILECDFRDSQQTFTRAWDYQEAKLAVCVAALEFYASEDDASINKEYCKEIGFDFTDSPNIKMYSDVAKEALAKVRDE